MTEKVHVALGDRAYDIFIGPGLIEAAPSHIAPFLNRNRVAIVTDENVAALHLSALETAFSDAGIESVSLALPAGEATKGWPQFSRTVEWLLENKVERNDVVIALGGGVIG
ncbi:MAG: 3-dehydroquinate synthase, partial [Paracoccaceae bacterium]|nr:3-dehydroquinate synthase [Paracoccaceae bacterium]